MQIQQSKSKAGKTISMDISKLVKHAKKLSSTVKHNRRPWETHRKLQLKVKISTTERVVKSRLVDQLTSNKLLNPHQSASMCVAASYPC